MKSTLILLSLFATVYSAPTIRRQSSTNTNNLQPFTAALGGIAATPVTDSGDAKRPFQVKGDTFVNLSAALARSCDQQFNACANKANGGDNAVSVGACAEQQKQCTASAKGGEAAQGSAGAGNAVNGTNAAGASDAVSQAVANVCALVAGNK